MVSVQQRGERSPMPARDAAGDDPRGGRLLPLRRLDEPYAASHVILQDAE